jgi:ATP-binding cassette, subfamily G (WHITE), member 2, PDR
LNICRLDIPLNWSIGISYEDMHNRFKGECIYLGELDNHFPELTVKETIAFVAATQESGRDRDAVSQDMGRTVASLFNLDEAMNTKIGNAMLRGVSGGEKRRVSIAEAFMSTSQVQCWDNSTRGKATQNICDRWGCYSH